MKNQHGPNMLAEAACEVNYNPRSVNSVSCSHCLARAAGTGSLMCCVCAIWVYMYWLSIHQLAQESLGHRGHSTWQYFTDTESFDWLNSGSADGLLQRRLPRCKKSFFTPCVYYSSLQVLSACKSGMTVHVWLDRISRRQVQLHQVNTHFTWKQKYCSKNTIFVYWVFQNAYGWMLEHSNSGKKFRFDVILATE